MSASAVTSDDAPPTGWTGHGIPWLLSASGHCVLLIGLALCVTLDRGAAAHRGPTTGIALDAAVVSSTFSPQQYDDERPEVSISNTLGDPNAEQPTETTSPTDANATTSGGGGPLADVLSAKPSVDLAGMLPAASPVLGAGSLEGGGIGTAKGTTARSQGSKSLKGGYARTGVFGVQGEGYKFVYVFDRSGSMSGHGGSPLAAAKSQLIASLKALGQTHQFQIIFYNEHPHVFNIAGVPGRLVFGTDQNKLYAEQFVNSVTADGATEHEEALALALRMSPDVIFFLTDADEPRLNSQQMARIARLNKGTSINAVEFGFGPQGDSDNFLVRLARENGGKHVYVDIGDLPQP